MSAGNLEVAAGESSRISYYIAFDRTSIVDRKFEQIAQADLQELGLARDYLMSIRLTPEQVQERFGIEFSWNHTEPQHAYFAAIKDPDSGYIFSFDQGSNYEGAPTMVVCALAKKVNTEEAFTALSRIVPIASKDVAWYSDSL